MSEGLFKCMILRPEMIGGTSRGVYIPWRRATQIGGDFSGQGKCIDPLSRGWTSAASLFRVRLVETRPDLASNHD